MSVLTDCLFSTVRNVSGKTMKFGFLPPHGWELDNQEERTVFGNISEAIVHGDHVSSKRHIDGFLRAIANGLLTIKNTPNPIMYDETDDETHMLEVDNDTVRAAQPCFSVDA